MKKTLGTGAVIGIIFGSIVLLLVTAVVVYFIVAAQITAAGSNHERGIEATYKNNEQILGTHSSKIAELVQVPALARDDFIALTTAAMEGRYGENGSQAVVNFVRENYPATLDATMYSRIQDEIIAGRNNFQANQTLLLDKKKTYEIELGYMFKGAFYRHLGFPKINLDEFKVVSSSTAREAFSTGVDDGLTLRRPEPVTSAQQ